MTNPESPAPHHNQPEFTVSEISTALKRTVETAYDYVRVRGEITGYKPAPSGHIYFSLKDENAVLNAVCWKGTASRLQCTPEDGLEVICTGKITTYPGNSRYQLVAETMEAYGVGAIMAIIEKRKKQLAAEGLFDPSRKRALPLFPTVIGVVTSPSGAVIRDILHRLADRYPCHVLLWPVLVQGDQAADQVVAAIDGFNALPPHIPKPDVLIVARGGGSFEDLLAFSEERVVRAAARSKIPLISAIGHETDTTLIDFVSDRRAPTPTAAAEMAVPVRHEWLMSLSESGRRMMQSIVRIIDDRFSYIDGLGRGLPNPQMILLNASQRHDDYASRLPVALRRQLEIHVQQLRVLSLRPLSLIRELEVAEKHLRESSSRLLQAYHQLLERQERHLIHQAALLESYHYAKVLDRGFAIIRDKNKVLTSVSKLEAGKAYSVEMKDGKRDIVVEGKVGRAPVKKNNPDQESLF